MSSLNGSADTSLILGAIAAALLLGLLPGATSALVAVLTGSVLLTLVLVLTLRRWVADRPSGSSEPADPEHGDEDLEPDWPSLGVARALFYFGLATLTWASFRPGLGLTLSELSFIAAFGVCAFAVLREARLAVLPFPILVAAAIFAFGGMISSVGAISPSGSVIEVLQGLYVIVIWAWTGAMVLRTRRQLATAVVLWVASAAFCGFAAITQVIGLEALTGAPEGQRMTGLMPHPNDLGGAMAIALVPALLVAHSAKLGRGVLAATVPWVPAAVIATGLVLSASVGGMAAAAVGLVIWLGAPSVARSARVAVAGLVLLAIVVSSAAGGRVTSPVERLDQVTSPAVERRAGSGQERISIAKTVWPRILDNPVVGTGMDTQGSAATIISRRRQATVQIHGLPLAAWYTAGIFGVVGLMILFGALGIITVRNLRTAASSHDALLGWALLGTTASFVVYTMNGPMSFQQYAWIAAVFAVVWSMRVRMSLARAAGLPLESPGMDPRGRLVLPVRERSPLPPGGLLPRGW